MFFQAKASGGKCFLHCHQGVSRSCAACIAYLIAKQGVSYDDGFHKVTPTTYLQDQTLPQNQDLKLIYLKMFIIVYTDSH